MTHFAITEAGLLASTTEEIDERLQNKYDAKIYCINNPVNPTIVDLLKTQALSITDNDSFDETTKQEACIRLADKIGKAYLCTSLVSENDISSIIDESRTQIYELFQLLKAR